MTPFSITHELRLWLGVERNATSHGEKWISAVGAFLGITSVYWITRCLFPGDLMGSSGGLLMLASMGASAVLLFAVPLGALSQPWAVIGGHLLSACIGVSCQKYFPAHSWTAPLAVCLAVGVMHYLRCIHPPGGATALAAVIGGPEIHNMGYQYLVMPVLVNVVAILLMAVAFNAFFPWRRYPAHFIRRRRPLVITQPAVRQFELTHEDFSAAMEELNSYVDITTENLTDLIELAKQHAEKNITHPELIIPGCYYSNGKLGRLWSVRQVMEVADTGGLPLDKAVVYKVVAGEGSGQLGETDLNEFRQWARFNVRLHESGRWVKDSA